MKPQSLKPCGPSAWTNISPVEHNRKPRYGLQDKQKYIALKKKCDSIFYVLCSFKSRVGQTATCKK